jgi:hypothetical protein
VLVFAVGAIAFVVGSELLVRLLVTPKDGFDAYRALLRSAKASTAAFGDSHVANAIESGPEIVNLGYAGETLPLMLAKARVYAESGRSRRVVLQLSPQQFAAYRVGKDQGEFQEELLGQSEPWLQFTRPHVRRYLLAYWQTVLSDPRRALAADPEPDSGPAESTPFSDLPPEEQRRSAEIRVQLHTPLKQGPAVEGLLRLLSAAFAELRGSGTEVCLVEYPLSSVYRRAASAVPSFALLRKRLRQEAAERDVPSVDLTESVPDSLFGDSDHLRPAGGHLVTGLILDRCFVASKPLLPERAR